MAAFVDELGAQHEGPSIRLLLSPRQHLSDICDLGKLPLFSDAGGRPEINPVGRFQVNTVNVPRVNDS
ncbi:hypothetical protein FQP90_04435 [Paenarthrobacter nitroguajacolicus]|uniref:Uncharacterized protein n=1 Tax=Paenarthrobacter nitroguajacolicus TaxID=211146 RepID=A0A558H8N3_PAENT|nr:hypothetical protein [Paenarthrobacter nitroguajacolicus]TVU65460.1 hypothetical protein FQP90_04435 [Paenarthrobacter nitroguajacolicus]